MTKQSSRARSIINQFRRHYLVASLIPVIFLLVLVLVFTVMTRNDLNDLITRSTHDLNQDAERSLQQLGEKIIMTKARDVAVQMEMYFRLHPDKTFPEMRRDPLFMRLAVQKVGETGYTALTEVKNWLFLVHPNAKLNDTDIRLLAKKMPDWWKIIERAVATGATDSGYYNWREPDGSFRKKFMVVTPVGVKHKGITIWVAATTYIDEFTIPVQKMKFKANAIVAGYQQYVARQLIWFVFVAASIILLTFAGIHLWGRRAGQRFITPIVSLAETAKKLGEGTWDVRLPESVLTRQDEIGIMSQSFAHMAGQLQETFSSLELRLLELQQARDALKESEEHYRGIIENIVDVYYRTDQEGKLVMISPSGATLLGYDSEAVMIGKNVVESFYYNPRDRENILRALEEKGSVQDFEATLKHRDNSPIRVSTSSRYYYDEKGELQGVEGIFRDVRERNRVQEALRESENKYRLITEKMSDIVWIADMNLRTVYVTPSVQRILGFTQEERKLQTVEQQFTPASLSYGLEALAKELALEERGTGDLNRNAILVLEYYHKDGSTRWMETIMTGIRDDQGVLTAIHGVSRDITARKQMEDALKKSEKKLSLIYENTPNAITISEIATGIIVDANKGIEWTGWSPEEIIGKSPEQLMSWTRPETGEIIRSIIKARGKLSNQHVEFYKKDGTIAQALMNSVRIEMDGKSYLLTISTDITKFSETEEKFTKAFMMIPEMVAITRVADGLIADVNMGFEEITGWKSREVIGRSSLDLNFWSNPAERDAMVGELKSGSDILHREFQFRRKDGILRAGIYSARSISVGGEAYLIFVMQDVTDRKQMEEDRQKLEQQLSQSHKMEAIGTLAGGIAHDFNNILSGIMGYTELSINEVRDRPKAYHCMEQVLTAADRARALVQQILTLSRKTTPEKKPISLGPIVKEVVKFMRASLPTTIEIRSAADDTTNTIMADPTQMHQVLMNLCANAGHSMRETGGVLEIGLRETMMGPDDLLRFPHLKSGRYQELFVRDTGHGISQKNISRIFDPYFTTKEKGEGTGLGLSVVHGIVKDHGGEIKVYSEEGSGTVFRIYLPLMERPSVKGLEDEKKDEEAVPRGRGERLLFIDDEKMVVEMNKGFLETLNYEVVSETDPARALETFRKNSGYFNMVITDKTMPHLTGFDVIRAVRSIRPDIPVILCSGYLEKEDREKMQEFGISRLVVKPIRLSILARVIHEELAGVRSEAGEA